MEKQERMEFISQRRSHGLEDEVQFNTQLDDVTELWRERETTGFDLNLATEFHPNLLDGTTEEGKAALKFWQKLYSGLMEETPRYTVLSGLDSLRYPWMQVFVDLKVWNVVFREEQSDVVFTGEPSLFLSRDGIHVNSENTQVFEAKKTSSSSKTLIPKINFGSTLSVVNTAIGEMIAKRGSFRTSDIGIDLKSPTLNDWLEEQRLKSS